MKNIIKNYMLFSYNVGKRSDFWSVSEEEIRRYRDNFVKSLDRFWTLPQNPSSKEKIMHKKVLSVCDEILEKNKIDIIRKEIAGDDPSILVVWKF